MKLLKKKNPTSPERHQSTAYSLTWHNHLIFLLLALQVVFYSISLNKITSLS